MPTEDLQKQSANQYRASRFAFVMTPRCNAVTAERFNNEDFLICWSVPIVYLFFHPGSVLSNIFFRYPNKPNKLEQNYGTSRFNTRCSYRKN